MALFTRSLHDLPRITVNDVHRIIQVTTKTPASKKDKGFKLYVSSYLHNYDVSSKESGEVTVRSECFRSMKKSQKPHCLSMVLRDSEPVVLLRCQCTCVAGTALQSCGGSAVPDGPLLSAEAYISSPSVQPYRN
uniref:Si:ch211-229b6.1 n=1 Tax=Nothobranchius furzeri TaxID=105023 RepID=A0A1A8B863_NOTFU